MQKRMKWFFSASLIGLMMIGLMGCVVAIPYAISYFSTPSEYIATAEIDHPADEVYDAVVRDAEGAGPGMKIVKRDDLKRLIEINDGVQTATVKVIEEGRGETQIIVTANKAKREEQEELSLQVLLHLCKRYGKECRVRES